MSNTIKKHNKKLSIQKNLWFGVFVLSVFFIFLGRGYQYIFWDAPYRVILWSENLMEPIINIFYNSWDDYAKDIRLTNIIQYFIKVQGIIFVFLAVFLLWKINLFNKFCFRLLYLYACLHIFLLSILNSLEHYGKIFSFLEHATQLSIPILFYILLQKKESTEEKELLVLKWAKPAIAVTFLSHGIYALGFHPVPGRFVDMTILILDCTETTARLFLQIAGMLDVVVAVGVFLPKINKYIFLYAFFWGIATALARIWGYIEWDNLTHSIHTRLFLVLYRLPHGLLPLICYLIVSKNSSNSTKVVLN